MNQIIRLLTAIILVLAKSAFLFAQSPDFCVTFDTLETGKNYTVGATTAETYVVAAENFRGLLRPFPGVGLPTASRGVVADAKSVVEKFPKAKGNVFQLQQSMLDFYWGDSRKVFSVCFDMFVGDGIKYFSVNGFPAILSKNINDLNGLSQALTGVKVKITADPGSNGRVVSVCMEGTITRFSIGGEDLIVDNFCFQTQSAPPVCRLSELKVFDLKCNADGKTYNARIRLTAKNSSDTLIGKTSRGYQFGFKVSENAVLIEGIPLPENGVDLITICDPLKPDCCVELRFRTPCASAPCTLGEIFAEQVCLPNGTFMVKLKFANQGAGQQFKVTANGAMFGIFSYDRLPVQIGPFTRPASGIIELKVQDLGRDCSTSARLNVDPCGSICNFNGLKAEVIACEGGKFYAGLSFQAPQADSSKAFAVFANGKLYGRYSYTENPLRLGPFVANGITSYNFLVVDVANPSCYSFTTLRPVICDGDSCKINDLVVKSLGCNPDGSQRILVDFKREGLQGESFGLFMGNGFIGNFPVSRLPLELTVRKPLGPATDVMTEFSVCVRGAQNCCGSVRVELKNCALPCREPSIVLDRKDCSPDTTFSVALKAGGNAESDFTYFIFLNEKIVDTLRPSDPATLISGLKGDGKTVYTILAVSISDGVRCVKTMKVGPISCLGPEASAVWPGDANQDNIVNFVDLLNIGVAYGHKGPARNDRTGVWQLTPASDWSQRFATGQNFKHADTNGDGTVDDEDIRVLRNNYGKRNGVQIQTAEQLPGTALDPGVKLAMPTSPLPATGTFEIPITLGSKDKPVHDLYGMAFVIKVDPRLIDLEKAEVIVPMSWMGRPGVNLTSVSKIYPEEGLIEVSITRTDQNEVSGYGEVAFLKGGIKDDIAGRFKTVEMHIAETGAARLSLEAVPLSGSTATFEVAQSDTPKTPFSAEEARSGLRIFPNPLTEEQLTVRHLSGYPVEEVQIFSLDGRPASPVFRQTETVSLADLPGGLYLVRIKVNGFVFYEKLIRSK